MAKDPAKTLPAVPPTPTVIVANATVVTVPHQIDPRVTST